MLIVDAHVHFYPCFERDTFLGVAADRFAKIAGGRDALGYLMLTESRGSNVFAAWRDGREREGRWSFEPSSEAVTLLARNAGGTRMAVIAGRQVATRGGLEVLALGTDAHIADDQAFEEAVESALSCAPLVVLPWGFGKWWGGRGSIVRDILERYAGRVYLGDNGGRPRVVPRPGLFDRAEALGMDVLPGSDPLPFAGHTHAVARAGFVLDAAVDEAQPLQAMLHALRAAPSVTAFGESERFGTFVRDQLRMQIVKRRRRAA